MRYLFRFHSLNAAKISIFVEVKGFIYRGCINKISHVSELTNLRNINRIEAR
jgi:hypothetical protein